jgi:phage I-like protein
VKYGYWNDISKQLFDPGASSWIHALPVGSYEHPTYGKLEFTPEKIKNFAQSVASKVRGIDPDIDYDHKDKDGKAAGWVKAAEARADGLYLQVDWTEPAAQAIKAGEYRYFSPEFDDSWTDAQGNVHTDVLFGGALTNRPFLKDLLPVNLSEIATTKTQGGKLDLKALRAALQLAESVSDEDVLAATLTRLAAPTPVPTLAPTPVALSEEDKLAKLLAESPTFKLLQEQQKQLSEQLAESERQRALSETRHRLSSLTATNGGRKFVLPPAVIDSVAEGTVSGDPVKMSEAFLQGLEALTKVGFVELGERGRTSNNSGEKDATQQLAETVAAAQAQHFKTTGKQLSYSDAVRYVGRVAPELYLEHRENSYAGKEE